MSALHVTGGKRLKGTVRISGAKNAASKMLIATLLTEEPVTLHNIPLQQETDIACELIRTAGAQVKLDGHTANIQVPSITSTSTLAQSRKNRLSILLAAPLLHRAGSALICRVEGDQIGPRPIDFHLDALQRMGAKIEERADGWFLSVNGRLQGIEVHLPYPSVGATETILFAGVLAEGKTIIENAATEPEIQDLIQLLRGMGAQIVLEADRRIVIEGVEKLEGYSHTILPDRLEAASYACIALATRGEIHCLGARGKDMLPFLQAVERFGGEYKVFEDGITFIGKEDGAKPVYRGLEIHTDTFPGFSTDWQQPFVVLMTQAAGTSYMHETVYEDRFKYVDSLVEMGAHIELAHMPESIQNEEQMQHYRQTAVVRGPTPLHATKLTVPDIRAGLAYVVAALVAEGTSVIDGLHHLERGYEDLLGKLQAIGADIVLK